MPTTPPGQRLAPPIIHRDHVEQLIAVVGAAVAVDHQQAVAITIERDAEIGLVRDDCRLEMLRVGGPDAFVDVQPVRLGANGDDVGTELVEYRRRHVVGGAVRAIDDDAPALEIELGRKRALAEFDVAAAGILDPARLAELRRRHAGERLLHHAFDRLLDAVRQLRPRLREELDPVVVERVVRCADHDAGGKAQRSREVRDCRRGQRAGQIDVDAGSGQARFQGGFQQIAGDARVLADQHSGPDTVAGGIGGEHETRGPAELEDELGRDRGFAHAPANAIGAEITSRHRFNPFDFIKLHVRRRTTPSSRRPWHARRAPERSPRHARRRRGRRQDSRASAHRRFVR